MAVLTGPKGTTLGHERIRRASGSLAAVDTAGGVFAWQNPEGVAIIVTRLLLDITTATSGACTIDAGAAANATTLSNTLIDGLDANAAAGVFDNTVNGGTSGAGGVRVAENGGAADWVTGSVASGASAGLVGSFHIEYVIA